MSRRAHATRTRRRAFLRDFLLRRADLGRVGLDLLKVRGPFNLHRRDVRAACLCTRSRFGCRFLARLEFTHGFALVGGRRRVRFLNGRGCRRMLHRLDGFRGERGGVMRALGVRQRVGVSVAISLASMVALAMLLTLTMLLMLLTTVMLLLTPFSLLALVTIATAPTTATAASLASLTLLAVLPRLLLTLLERLFSRLRMRLLLLLMLRVALLLVVLL